MRCVLLVVLTSVLIGCGGGNGVDATNLKADVAEMVAMHDLAAHVLTLDAKANSNTIPVPADVVLILPINSPRDEPVDSPLQLDTGDGIDTIVAYSKRALANDTHNVVTRNATVRQVTKQRFDDIDSYIKQRDAKLARLRDNFRNLHNGLLMYSVDNNRHLPPTLDKAKDYFDIRFPGMLKHPLTGEANGVTYFKPDPPIITQLDTRTILLAETIGGKTPPAGYVCRVDGTIEIRVIPATPPILIPKKGAPLKPKPQR